MSNSAADLELLRLSAEIVSAHAGHNPGSARELPAFIHSVYAALSRATTLSEPSAPLEPAVPIKKSVFPGYLVCLEDGKKLKMLKRHLQSSYGMTPDQYRARWGLPPTYPMVAPGYASHRSELARKIGLGRKPDAAPSAPPEVAPEVTVQHVPLGNKGKKPKAKTPDVSPKPTADGGS